MRTKQTFVSIHIRNKGEVGAVHYLYLQLQNGASFVAPFYLCFMSIMLSCLLLTAVWSPAEKELSLDSLVYDGF